MRKNAFTLAEVLVTLGIIGVISALTLPTLIRSHQKQEFVVRLQKSYSTLAQGIDRMMVEEKAVDIRETSLFRDCSNSDDSGVSCSNAFRKYFNVQNFEYVTEDNMTEYANVLACDSVSYNGEYWEYSSCYKSQETSRDYLVNATKFLMNDGSMVSVSRYDNNLRFAIDVNGAEAPNTWDRDVFLFKTNPNGTIEPTGNYRTIGGAAQIIRDGWKMNY